MAALNNYKPEQSVDLYASSGDTDDYLYGEQGSFSFTYELATSFIPDPSQIPSICEVNVKAARYLLDNCADAFPFLAHTVPAPAAGPLPITATYDRVHHPFFVPTEVKLIVGSGSAAQEIALTVDPADPNVFRGELPAAEQNGRPVEYFFGLKDKDGRVARCPRLTSYSLLSRNAVPVLLLPPAASGPAFGLGAPVR